MRPGIPGRGAGPAMGRNLRTWATVPLKSPSTAKSRLRGLLSPEQREELYRALATRLLCILAEVGLLERVLVVTASGEMAALAREHGAVVLSQCRDQGLNFALAQAMRVAAEAGVDRLLVLPGDLPGVTVPAIEALLTAAPDEPHLLVVPDRHGRGTNALLCAPPTAAICQFGDDSHARHLRIAQALGLHAISQPSPALALDIDEPADLAAWRADPTMSWPCPDLAVA